MDGKSALVMSGSLSSADDDACQSIALVRTSDGARANTLSIPAAASFQTPAVMHLASLAPILSVVFTSNSLNVELYVNETYVETLRGSPTDKPNEFRVSHTLASASGNLKIKCLSIKPKGETHLRVSALDIEVQVSPPPPPSPLEQSSSPLISAPFGSNELVATLLNLGINPMEMMVRFTKLEQEVKQLQSSNASLARKVNLIGGVLTKAHESLTEQVHALSNANVELHGKVEALTGKNAELTDKFEAFVRERRADSATGAVEGEHDFISPEAKVATIDTPLTKEQIVDTNGAGDAFVGGLLAKLVELGAGNDDACAKSGADAACVTVQRSGCTFPYREVGWKYEGALLGMGNPLMDMSNFVEDSVLEEYGLASNNAILAEEKHMSLYTKLSATEGVLYIPGGATQNSIRVAQWCLSKALGAGPSYTSCMGCIGADSVGARMESGNKEIGVSSYYMKDESTPTGTCAVLVNGDKGHRSLVTNLAAANNFKEEHLDHPTNWAVVEKARIVYSAGLFITVSVPSMMRVAKHCLENQKTYCLNLSAPFLMMVPPFKAAITALMPMVDYLFANEAEALEFAKSEGWTETDVAAVAAKISLLSSEKSTPRTVVITQGADPTIIARSGELETYPINPLTKEQIVDTNGAGDAFVGGFLAKLVELGAGNDAACAKSGADAACVIIQRSGCTIPMDWISHEGIDVHI
jgi:adenosine kinase